MMHYPTITELRRNPNALAWFLLSIALALHVLDEAANDFLSFYNPLVLELRERIGFWPMPTFTFEVWISGLILLIIVLFLSVPLVERGGRPARVITTAFAFLMIPNALAHLLFSLYLGWIVPGFWSSFLLLPAAVFAFWRGVKGDWRTARGAA